MDIIWLIAGMFLLIKGADFFVDGASSVAARLGVPPLIIGLTVVSFGTSAPEAAISISASISGSNAISLGNVIGSNMFNLLMAIGLTALVIPLSAEGEVIKRDMPLCFFASGALAITMLDGEIGRFEAAFFLAALAAYLFAVIRSALNKPVKEEGVKPCSLSMSLLLIAVGAASVVIGGDLAVESAVKIAGKLGMSEMLVGLTVVAFGTSLPELVTSLTAARKGESGIAVGNAIGSCLFNILFIIGITGTIKPIVAEGGLLADVSVLSASALVLYLIAAKKRAIGRMAGSALVLIYCSYTIFIVLRAV